MPQKRKAADSKMETKLTKAGKTPKDLKLQSEELDDDISVVSEMESKFSKEEERELKELVKNYLIGDKPLNIKMEHAPKRRQVLFDRLEKEGIVKVTKVETVTTKSYELTEKGFHNAASKEYFQDLSNEPSTDRELHEHIKKWSYHPKTGAKMFDILLEVTKNRKTISKTDLARQLGTESSKTNFFYTLQQLKNQGYVYESEMKTLRLRKKAFVAKQIPFGQKEDNGKETNKDTDTASVDADV